MKSSHKVESLWAPTGRGLGRMEGKGTGHCGRDIMLKRCINKN